MEDWRELIIDLKEEAQEKCLKNSEIARACAINPSTVTRVFALEFPPNLVVYLAMKGFIKKAA
jgi:hypothetical protein